MRPIDYKTSRVDSSAVSAGTQAVALQNDGLKSTANYLAHMNDNLMGWMKYKADAKQRELDNKLNQEKLAENKRQYDSSHQLNQAKLDETIRHNKSQENIMRKANIHIQTNSTPLQATDQKGAQQNDGLQNFTRNIGIAEVGNGHKLVIDPVSKKVLKMVGADGKEIPTNQDVLDSLTDNLTPILQSSLDDGNLLKVDENAKKDNDLVVNVGSLYGAKDK